MEKGGVWEIKVQEAGERGMEGWIFLPYCPPLMVAHHLIGHT